MNPSTVPIPEAGVTPFDQELLGAFRSLDDWKRQVLDFAAEHPLEALVTLVLGSSWAFYQAEKDENPAVNTYDDAVYYISTCLSVGYANIFPVTQNGKFVAAMVMMVGPSLSNWVVEGHLTARGPQKTDATQGETLQQILAELRAIRAQTAGPNTGGDAVDAVSGEGA